MYGIGLSAVCISNSRSGYGKFIPNINSFVEKTVVEFIEELKHSMYYTFSLQ